MRDRRFEPRQPSADHIELSWADGSASGKLTDLSRSGARLALDCPIRVGTPVRVMVGGVLVTGRVASCLKPVEGYSLGIEFDPEFQSVLKRKK